MTRFFEALDGQGAVRSFGELIERIGISKMREFGHSLLYGYGASDPDRDVSTHLASMLKAREIPLAQNGAVLHWPQANAGGDGGYVKVLQEEVRKVRVSTTLGAQATAGATTINVVAVNGIAIGDLISIGIGDAGSTGSEVAWVTGLPGAPNLTVKLNGQGGLARTHLIGEPVFVVPHLYCNVNPLYLCWYGINDLAHAAITGAAIAGRQDQFKMPLRTVLSRMRCAEVYEEDHSSNVYTGSWNPSNAVAQYNSGSRLKQVTGINAKVTIHVPDNFPGGAVLTHFVGFGVTATVPVITFTVDGVAAGTMNLDVGYAGKVQSWSKRFTGLAAGRHKIECQFTTVGVATLYFDFWGIESVEPPLIACIGAERPYGYSIYAAYENQRLTGTLSALKNAGTTAWAVNALSAAPLPGATVTFEEGTGNAETLEVAASPAPTTTTFTTTTASANSHASASAFTVGIQDADIPKLNTMIQSVCNEFTDGRVVFVDVDAVINKQAQYFFYDDIHHNDWGNAVIVHTIYDRIMGAPATAPQMMSFTAAPAAPLPDAIPFLTAGVTALNTTWTSMPAALTELFGTTLGPTYRKLMDLRRTFEASLRVNVRTGGTSGASLRVQYSLDNGTTWKYIDRTALYAEGTGLACIVDTPGNFVSPWNVIAAEAAAADNVLVRIVGVGGNGANSPVFGNIELAFR